MNFKSKTEKEIQEENLMPEGVYPFEVINAVDKKSKKGNDMIELTIVVFNGERKHQLLDWIMEKVMFKLFHFCAYSGLSKAYESGTLKAADCVGKNGYAKIIVQEDESGQFPDRNSVKDYVRAPVKKSSEPEVKKVETEDVPY